MTTKTLLRIIVLVLLTLGSTRGLIAQPPPTTPREAPAKVDNKPDLWAPEEPTTNGNGNLTDSRFFSEFVRMMLSLGFILALLLLGTWFFKRVLNQRLQQVNLTSTIKILEKRALNPKAAVYLLEVENRKVLIAEAPGGISSLAVFPPVQEKVPFRDIYLEKQTLAEKEDV